MIIIAISCCCCYCSAASLARSFMPAEVEGLSVRLNALAVAEGNNGIDDGRETASVYTIPRSIGLAAAVSGRRVQSAWSDQEEANDFLFLLFQAEAERAAGG